MSELTEFQVAIVRVLRASPNQMAERWEIAIRAFPEKWARPQGRGALIGHIDRAAAKLGDMIVRLPPRDCFSDATLCLHLECASPEALNELSTGVSIESSPHDGRAGE